MLEVCHAKEEGRRCWRFATPRRFYFILIQSYAHLQEGKQTLVAVFQTNSIMAKDAFIRVHSLISSHRR